MFQQLIDLFLEKPQIDVIRERWFLNMENMTPTSSLTKQNFRDRLFQRNQMSQSVDCLLITDDLLIKNWEQTFLFCLSRFKRKLVVITSLNKDQISPYLLNFDYQHHEVANERLFLISQKDYCAIDVSYEVRQQTIGHHDDRRWKDEAQREVYQLAAKFMRGKNMKRVIDIGCGSGYKLIKYLGEFETIGIETEPCYSELKKRYPDRHWELSGEKEKDFNKSMYETDLIICSDVIEHIVNPDVLIDYIRQNIKYRYLLFSTPDRQTLSHHRRFRGEYTPYEQGPPKNTCHVREWTCDEFKHYLQQYFQIVTSALCQQQIECQYALVMPKKRIAVVTAIFGSNFMLNDPINNIQLSEDTDFYCFTDRTDLVSDYWQIIQTPYHSLDQETDLNSSNSLSNQSLDEKTYRMMVAKYYKINHHRIDLLKAYQYTVWLDSSAIINQSQVEENILNLSKKGDLWACRHSMRACPQDEFIISCQLDKYKNQKIKEQMEHYQSLGMSLEKPTPLYECGFLLRNNESKQVATFMDIWWQENQKWSYQDQLSFSYVGWLLDFMPQVVKANVHKNSIFGFIYYWSRHRSAQNELLAMKDQNQKTKKIVRKSPIFHYRSDHLLTILIPTNTVPSSPQLTLIKRVYRHLRSHPDLSDCPVIVGLDHHGTERCDQYQENLNTWVATEKNVSLIVTKEGKKLETSFLNLIKACQTPYLLFWEHDWEFNDPRQIPIKAILDTFESHPEKMNYLRFNKRTNMECSANSDAYLDYSDIKINGRPILKTSGWSNNPYLARTKTWHEQWLPMVESPDWCPTDIYPLKKCQINPQNIEGQMLASIQQSIQKKGFSKTHVNFGTYLWGDFWQSGVVHHLDGLHYK